MPRRSGAGRKSTLNTYLAAVGISTVLALESILVTAGYFIQTSIMQASLVRVADEVGERLSHSLENLMWNYEDSNTLLLLETEAKADDLVYIVASDADRNIYFSVTKDSRQEVVPYVGSEKPATEAMKTSYDHQWSVVHAGQIIGFVSVGVSAERRTSAFTRELLTVSLLGLLISLSTVISVIVAVRRLVVKRLYNLQEEVSSLAENGFAKTFPTGRMDEIGRLTQRFNEMAATILEYRINMEHQVQERTSQLIESEKLAFLGSLVAGIAHEINTPLGVSITAITYLENRIAEVGKNYDSGELTKAAFDGFLEELKRSAKMISANLQRTGELVHAFKGIGADQLSDDLRVFNLSEYLNEVIFSLSPRIKKTAHKVEVECDPHLRLKSYPSAFYQIISNLVVNSLTHGQSGKDGQEPISLKIRARTEEGKLLILYSDDGVGIPEDIIGNIFNPFFTTRRGQGGTGLGLYIVYTLVNKLEGTITCTSDPGKGVLFTILLPERILAR